MVDRKARDRMAAVLRAYMDEKIAAVPSMEVLEEVADSTQDETVVEIGWALYAHYYDIFIDTSKGVWGFLNRLLLLLESEEEIEEIRGPRKWHYRQAIAAICLVAFALIAFKTGFGALTLVSAVAFGLVSMLLAWLNSRQRRKEASVVEAETAPFPSASSLLSVRRRVAGFSRMRYPKAIVRSRIKYPVVEKIVKIVEKVIWIMDIPRIICWLLGSPVVLFFQMFPESGEMRIGIKKGPRSPND